MDESVKRQNTLLLLLLLYEKERYKGLLKYLPEEDASYLEKQIEDLSQLPAKKRFDMVLSSVKKYLFAGEYAGIKLDNADVILDILKNESPRTIALMLRYMPEEISRRILQELPPKIKKRLPGVSSLADVPKEVINHIRFSFKKVYIERISGPHGKGRSLEEARQAE